MFIGCRGYVALFNLGYVVISHVDMYVYLVAMDMLICCPGYGVLVALHCTIYVHLLSWKDCIG